MSPENHSATFSEPNRRLFDFEEKLPTNSNGNRTTFGCAKCEKRYAYRKSLNQHYRSAHAGVRFYCELCGNDFAKKANLKSHMRSSHGFGIAKLFDCSNCEKKYPELKSLKRHYRSAHLGVRFYCQLCEDDFTQKHHLKSHLRSSHGYGIRKNLDCSKCEKTYSEKKHLNRHYRTAHSELRFYCELCGQDFARLLKLRSHAKSVHFDVRSNESGRRIRRRRCQSCGEYFAGKVELKSHTESVHFESNLNESEPERFDLELRGHDLGSKEYFERPFRGDSAPKAYDCAQCGKTYSGKGNLNKHRESAHSGVRYYCDLCGKKFVKKYSVKRHMSAFHGRATWQIIDSSKRESTPPDVTDKLALYDNAPYRSAHSAVQFCCVSCGDSFVDKANLTIHIQSVHLEIKIDD